MWSHCCIRFAAPVCSPAVDERDCVRARAREDPLTNKMRRFLKWQVGKLTKLSEGKQHVGSDRFGNQYFYKPPTPGVRYSEKREVLPADGDSLMSGFDANSLPVLWASWIAYRRDTPPTPEEQAREDRRVEEMAIKARAIEQREAAMRIEEAARVQATGSAEDEDGDAAAVEAEHEASRRRMEQSLNRK